MLDDTAGWCYNEKRKNRRKGRGRKEGSYGRFGAGRSSYQGHGYIPRGVTRCFEKVQDFSVIHLAHAAPPTEPVDLGASTYRSHDP